MSTGQTLTISQECQREQELQEILWNPQLMREYIQNQRQQYPPVNLMRALELQRAEDVKQIMQEEQREAV